MNLAKCSARDGREEGAWGDITCIDRITEGRLAVYYRHRPPVIGRVAILARSSLSRVCSKVVREYDGGNSPFLAKLPFSKFGSNSRESVCYICVWTGVGCTIGRRVDINCRVFRLAVRGE